MRGKIKKWLNWTWENISAILRILIVLFIAISTIYAIDSDVLRSSINEWWLIAGAILLTFYFLDDSANKQMHGK